VPNSNPKLEQVWILHREVGEPHLTSIKNVALEKHLYSPKLPDGSRDPRLEKKLASLEGALSKIWPNRANGFVDLGSKAIRHAIALFLSVQFLRHPDRRDTAVKIRGKLIDAIKKLPVDAGGLPVVEEIQISSRQYTVDAADWDKYLNAGNSSSIDNWRWFIEKDAQLWAKMLMQKRGSIVFVNEPLFVTCDYPFCVPQPTFERHQIGGKEALILFPISPTRLLCLDDQNEPANQYYQVPNAAADEYNTFTWVNTNAFMISSRKKR